MAEVPGRLLRDAQLAAQLHAGDALDAGGQQVDGQRPGAVAELGVGHDRVGAHGEALAAAAAAVGHAGVGAGGLHVGGMAMGEQPG